MVFGAKELTLFPVSRNHRIEGQYHLVSEDHVFPLSRDAFSSSPCCSKKPPSMVVPTGDSAKFQEIYGDCFISGGRPSAEVVIWSEV